MLKELWKIQMILFLEEIFQKIQKDLQWVEELEWQVEGYTHCYEII
jgi:hypothetical protein